MALGRFGPGEVHYTWREWCLLKVVRTNAVRMTDIPNEHRHLQEKRYGQNKCSELWRATAGRKNLNREKYLQKCANTMAIL